MKSRIKHSLFFFLVLLATTIPLCNTKKVSAQLPPAPTDLGVFTTPRLLSVTKSGAGTGTVTGVGVNCGTNCFQNYENGTVTVLTASPTGGSTFAGWSGGGCSGTGTCSVTMSSAQSVIATFNLTANIFAGPPSASPGGSTGSCLTIATACDVFRALQVVSCGQTLQLNNGVYTGTRYMLDFATATVTNRICSAASPIQISTETDGGVFINGEFLRRPFRTHAISYWYFDGFDAGNSSNSVFANTSTVAGASNNLIVRRVCFSNAKPVPGAPIPPQNEHVIDFSFIDSSLFVDVCGFGTGRTVITDYGEDTTHNANNVFRRMWMRWEGFPVSNNSDGTFCAPSPPLQYGYLTKGPTTWENIISIHDPEQYNLATWGTWTSCSSGVPYAPGITPARGASTFTYPGGAYTFRGLIVYGYNGFTSVGQTAMRNGEAWTYSIAAPSTFVDFYHDSRSQANGTGLVFFCTAAVAPACTSNSADRLTNIRVSTGTAPQYDTFGTAVPTNSNDCIATSGATGASLGGCPSFYTGDTPGTGARNCFEYTNGALTSTKLWPWRMDDRIKAALARANAAGTGGSALAGSAGSGGTSTWAAGTVTSEIVSRYGAIPSACVR